MLTSLSVTDIAGYTSKQLNYFFPDNNAVDLNLYKDSVKQAHDRLEYCFKHVSLKHYFDGTQVSFNHLFSDHYVLYLWFLANTIWKNNGDISVCNKLYYLNKSLHGLDCNFNTAMPDIFLVFHGVGTMLGKAEYNDFFVVLHGCTVGSHKGAYPIIGKGVSLTANSSVLGACNIGNRVSIGSGTTLFQQDVQEDYAVSIGKEQGILKLRPSNNNYAQQFFNVNLNTLA